MHGRELTRFPHPPSPPPHPHKSAQHSTLHHSVPAHSCWKSSICPWSNHLVDLAPGKLPLFSENCSCSLPCMLFHFLCLIIVTYLWQKKWLSYTLEPFHMSVKALESQTRESRLIIVASSIGIQVTNVPMQEEWGKGGKGLVTRLIHIHTRLQAL